MSFLFESGIGHRLAATCLIHRVVDIYVQTLQQFVRGDTHFRIHCIDITRDEQTYFHCDKSDNCILKNFCPYALKRHECFLFGHTSGEKLHGKVKKEARKTKEYGHLSRSIFRMPFGYDRIVFKLLMGLLFYPKVNIFPPKSIPPYDKFLLARRFLFYTDRVGDYRQPMNWRMASMRS